MRRITFICSLLLFAACGDNNERIWRPEWDKHNDDFKKVVSLIKADKLKVVYGRAGFAIPDSIDLKIPYGQLAFRETDFTYDSTYSILFYLNPANTRSGPIIVYTNNKKRIAKYENTSATRIEENWYFTYH